MPWQIEAKTHTNIGRNMVETKRPLARVHEPGVVENCPARLFNDRKSNLDSGARHCFAAKRLAVLILRTDFAIREPAEII